MTQDPYAPPESSLDGLARKPPAGFRLYFKIGFIGSVALLFALTVLTRRRFVHEVFSVDGLLALALASLVCAALMVPMGRKWPHVALACAPVATLAIFFALMFGLGAIF